MLSVFSDEEADAMMGQVQEICRVDNYWSDGEGGNAGWEVMYVRLRGLAVLQEGKQ